MFRCCQSKNLRMLTNGRAKDPISEMDVKYRNDRNYIYLSLSNVSFKIYAAFTVAVWHIFFHHIWQFIYGVLTHDGIVDKQLSQLN